MKEEEVEVKYLDKEINPEVPPETALKWALVENGKLKAEIDFLEHELEKKNTRIRAYYIGENRLIIDVILRFDLRKIRRGLRGLAVQPEIRHQVQLCALAYIQRAKAE